MAVPAAPFIAVTDQAWFEYLSAHAGDRPLDEVNFHCKPWRDCNNDERLDGENGLLLTPSIDHLFDRGFISFSPEGCLLVSPVAHRQSLARMGVPIDRQIEVGAFTAGQRRFLEYHVDAVFLRSRVGTPD